MICLLLPASIGAYTVVVSAERGVRGTFSDNLRSWLMFVHWRNNRVVSSRSVLKRRSVACMATGVIVGLNGNGDMQPMGK